MLIWSESFAGKVIQGRTDAHKFCICKELLYKNLGEAVSSCVSLYLDV